MKNVREKSKDNYRAKIPCTQFHMIQHRFVCQLQLPFQALPNHHSSPVARSAKKHCAHSNLLAIQQNGVIVRTVTKYNSLL